MFYQKCGFGYTLYRRKDIIKFKFKKVLSPPDNFNIFVLNMPQNQDKKYFIFLSFLDVTLELFIFYDSNTFSIFWQMFN